MNSKAKRVAAPAKKGKAPAKPQAAAATGSKPAQDQPAILDGIECELKRMVDVVIDDKSKDIENSKRWPLLVDLHGSAVTFLRHRDTNYLLAANQRDMEKETVRRALLGAIRFGKPFVIDILDTDTFDHFEKALNEIQPDLFKDLLSKGLLQDEKFLKLVRDEDGELYSSNHSYEYRPDDFKLVITTTKNIPDERLLRLFFPVRVK